MARDWLSATKEKRVTVKASVFPTPVKSTKLAVSLCCCVRVCVHVCLFAPCFLCIHASLSVLFLLHGYRQRKLVETLRYQQPQRRSRRLSP